MLFNSEIKTLGQFNWRSKPMQRISDFLVGQMSCDTDNNRAFSEEATDENYSTVCLDVI